MKLRPYQTAAVDAVLRVVEADGRALLVAPTGAGKTVMLSELCRRLPRPILVLQHREELLQQNTAALRALSGLAVSTVSAESADYTAPIVSAMQPTLTRRLKALDWTPATIVVDECHHAPAPSYQRILDHWPDAVRVGVTATPNRPDRRPLGPVFGTAAAHIRAAALEDAGYLVPHRVVSVECVDRLAIDQLPMRGGEYEPEAIAELYTADGVTSDVVDAWEQTCSERQTVVFCATRTQSAELAAEYLRRGYTVTTVDGETPARERARRFASLRDGSTQVLVNVAVATEGWDCPPVSCVVLARPCSAHATLVQMVGRGKRPSAGKRDCVVLDCGYSLQRHPSLEVEPQLWPEKGRAPERECEGCGVRIPATCPDCPYCGHEHTRDCWSCGAAFRESLPRCPACGVLQAVEATKTPRRLPGTVTIAADKLAPEVTSCRLGRDGSWLLTALLHSPATDRFALVVAEYSAPTRSIEVEVAYMGPRRDAAEAVWTAIVTTRVRPTDLRTIIPGDFCSAWMDAPTTREPNVTQYASRCITRWNYLRQRVVDALRQHTKDYPCRPLSSTAPSATAPST